MDYSLVIPVYNSAATLEELYNRIIRVFSGISKEYEIIFVDDCSKDGSWEKLEMLRFKDAKRVKAIQLMRNYGQHNAIMCGLHIAQGEYIITLDDDLQNPPEEITKLINEISKGYDLVYGNYLVKKHNSFRNIGSSLIQMMYRSIFKTGGNLTSFRIARKQLIKYVLDYNKSYVFIDGLLAWNTKNIGFVSVVHDAREKGRSGYGILKLISLSFDMLTNFTIFPLQVISLLGILFASLGFLMAIFYFVKKVLYDIPVTGFTSLIIAITIFSGVQLLTLGLIGEYIGRIHIKINEKPQYNIRKELL
jgi:glycosyltransferase involved in cell wall biosynthesis